MLLLFTFCIASAFFLIFLLKMIVLLNKTTIFDVYYSNTHQY